MGSRWVSHLHSLRLARAGWSSGRTPVEHAHGLSQGDVAPVVARDRSQKGGSRAGVRTQGRTEWVHGTAWHKQQVNLSNEAPPYLSVNGVITRRSLVPRNSYLQQTPDRSATQVSATGHKKPSRHAKHSPCTLPSQRTGTRS